MSARPCAKPGTLEQSTFSKLNPMVRRAAYGGLQGLASCLWRSENGAAALREAHSHLGRTRNGSPVTFLGKLTGCPSQHD
jgi:hypothetical protein